MKAGLYFVVSISVAVIAAIASERIAPFELPPAVQKSLDLADQGDRVKEITIDRTSNGRIYDVEFDRRGGPGPHVRISEQGRIISDTRKIPSTDAPPIFPKRLRGAGSSLQIGDVPAPAQHTIQRKAAGREIASLTEEMIDGRHAYAVQFRDRGRNPWVHIAEDGTVLRPAERPRPLGLGTTLSDTPERVQRTIQREIGDGEIERVEKRRESDGSDVYLVKVKDDRGAYQLRISADGRVLENTRPTEIPGKRG